VARGGDESDDITFTTVGRGGRAMQFTADGIFKHLQAVQEARGKKVGSVYYMKPSVFTRSYHRTQIVENKFVFSKSCWK
jgi:hypothetical protein